jgi:hypothetical protein
MKRGKSPILSFYVLFLKLLNEDIDKMVRVSGPQLTGSDMRRSRGLKPLFFLGSTGGSTDIESVNRTVEPNYLLIINNYEIIGS